MSWFGSSSNDTDKIRREISDLEYKKRNLESDLRRTEIDRDRAESDKKYYSDAENDRNHKDYWKYEDALSMLFQYSREIRNIEEEIWDIRIEISNLERNL